MTTLNPFARFICVICGRKRPNGKRRDVVHGNRRVIICVDCYKKLEAA